MIDIEKLKPSVRKPSAAEEASFERGSGYDHSQDRASQQVEDVPMEVLEREIGDPLQDEKTRESREAYRFAEYSADARLRERFPAEDLSSSRMVNLRKELMLDFRNQYLANPAKHKDELIDYEAIEVADDFMAKYLKENPYLVGDTGALESLREEARKDYIRKHRQQSTAPTGEKATSDDETTLEDIVTRAATSKDKREGGIAIFSDTELDIINKSGWSQQRRMAAINKLADRVIQMTGSRDEWDALTPEVRDMTLSAARQQLNDEGQLS